MDKIRRRNALKVSIAGAAATTITDPQLALAKEANPIPAPDQEMTLKGETFAPNSDSNPLEAKIITFTTVSS
jgi:hypothetical protein